MGCVYEAAHHEAALHDAEHHCSPCLDEDRASLRVVSGVAGGGRIIGDVDGRCSALGRVRAVDVRGYICSDRDGGGNFLSGLWPSPLFTGVRGRFILRSSPRPERPQFPDRFRYCAEQGPQAKTVNMPGRAPQLARSAATSGGLHPRGVPFAPWARITRGKTGARTQWRMRRPAGWVSSWGERWERATRLVGLADGE